MAVKARLEGHAFDLEALARHFDHGDVRVASDDQGYYLTSPALDAAGNDGGKLMDTAQAAVRAVNGVAALSCQDSGPAAPRASSTGNLGMVAE